MNAVKLGELVASGEAIIKTGPFGTQLKAAEYVDYGTPVINVKNIGYGSVIRNKLDMVGQATLERLEAHILHAGDIVFGRKGAVDRHAYISEAEEGWMQGSDCIRLRIDSVRVNPRYLSYYFLTSKHKAFMISMCSHGTTMASLNQKILEQIEIPIPDIGIQNKIVSVLASIDARISLNEKINDNLQQQAHALFAQYYDQADHTVPFTSIIQILGGGTPKTGNPLFWNGSVPFFTPKDVGTPYTLTTEKTITEDGLAHCNSRLYPVNTVFVTARGTVGKVGLPGVPMAMNQSCYALVGKNIDQLLVYFYTLQTVQTLKHKASGAVFDAITTRDFETETIRLLEDDIAEEFLSIAKPMFGQILSNSIENQHLATLRNTLLPQLMSGEIDVSDIDI